ncbi:MAG: NAD(P)-binding domain-containing protein [Deltaproteobacteria bacterium]|jgi:NosR/NirI family nitrous oxide reductase transcriptional regulator
MNPLARYMHWLHTRWPAGHVEKMPEVGEDGVTAVPGVRIVGDLTGIPLLKFSAHTGARAVQAILEEPGFSKGKGGKGVKDLVIVGAGVSGIAAAVEAKKAGLSFVVYEAAEAFNTIVNFPKGKPIFTYPTDMTPAGDLQFTADVKEDLLAELERQKEEAGVEPVAAHIDRVEKKGDVLEVVHGGKGEAKVTRAQRVIIGIGRSGNYRRLGVPGQDKDKVYHRLYDPREYADKNVLIVGGGDSALESAIALAMVGANVTLSYRKPEFSRPKPENIEKLETFRRDPEAQVDIENPVSDRVNSAMGAGLAGGTHRGGIQLMMASKLLEVRDEDVRIQDADGNAQTIANDVVFAMIGREAPLDFFRRSKIPIRGEWTPKSIAAFAAFMLFCVFVYNWKSGSGVIHDYFTSHGWFPFGMKGFLSTISQAAKDPKTLFGTFAITSTEPGFYYALAYSVAVVAFGIDRIKRRRTPYVKTQTLTLMAMQLVPLFLLPYILLPYLGHNGVFDDGFGKTFADNLFPATQWSAHGREYWRAFGFVLAWPLFIWNFFTSEPMTWWLVIGGVQTFVIIPLMIRRWGKGAYCGWICSCGALAETLGDRHRTKMPHGPKWNRLNMIGQVVLFAAFVLFAARAISWWMPDSSFGRSARTFYEGLLSGWSVAGVQLNYYHVVDLFLAGIVGVGFYFWFSGRVWCRFACPLAALMHIYARFTKFRIFPEKKKCISCNVCTSVCHQGIDIMNFANKGLPMQDPECVRCSACVQMCPTGVLSFGRYTSGDTIAYDTLLASAAQIREAKAKS